MANSFIHARSSARRFGGEPAQYIAVHDWFDRTKEAYANFRHRAVRHCDYGVDLAVRAFGREWTAPGSIEEVAKQHVVEDLSRVPALAEWLDQIQCRHSWMTLKTVAAGDHAKSDAVRWGGKAEDYLPVHLFMDETENWFDGPAHRAVHHSAFGSFTTERMFGYALKVGEGKCEVPVRWITEAHIRRELGRIPSLQDWASCIQSEKWMNQVPHGPEME